MRRRVRLVIGHDYTATQRWRRAISIAVVTVLFWLASNEAQVSRASPQYVYFSPTPIAVADAMLKLAGVAADDVVYDLGSGDGRLVILAAQKYGATGVGVEMESRLVEISRQAARNTGVAGRVTFIQEDFFTTDISKATVVTLYLSAAVNRQLEPKLRRELKPGTRIVSHQFGIGTWRPDQTVRTSDARDLFLWIVPHRSE